MGPGGARRNWMRRPDYQGPAISVTNSWLYLRHRYRHSGPTQTYDSAGEIKGDLKIDRDQTPKMLGIERIVNVGTHY